MKIDSLATTDAERASLAALRDATGEVGGPMERHSSRLFVIAERLARDAGTGIDREVVLCACWLHDIGLYLPDHESYVTGGKHFAERLLSPFGWPRSRVELCGDAIERHHEVASQWSRGAEVEFVRRADLIDVAGLLVSDGIPRGWLRGLYREIPRAGLYGEIGSEVLRMAVKRPLTLPRIFFPGG